MAPATWVLVGMAGGGVNTGGGGGGGAEEGGPGVGLAAGVSVGEAAVVPVGWTVGVATVDSVGVTAAVGVAATVGVDSSVGTGVDVAVAVADSVGVGEAVGGTSVGVAVGVWVGRGVLVGMTVGVAVCAFLWATSVACMDGGGVMVARGDPAAVGVAVDDALGMALPVGRGVATATDVVGVLDGAVVGVAETVNVAATTAEAMGAPGVGVAISLAA